MTAATETDPILEAVLAERWHMASTDVRDVATVPREVNSESMTQLIDAFRTIASRMVHEIRGEPEASYLDDLEFTLLGAIEEHIVAFAQQIETLRAEARKGAASPASSSAIVRPWPRLRSGLDVTSTNSASTSR